MSEGVTHVLVVQWDSWITTPDAWDPAWLSFDYVGAPWWHRQPHERVGCGGFSLRSVRLLERLALDGASFPLDPRRGEDDLLCRGYRLLLEPEGFRWAPPEVATRFAFEAPRPPCRTFGFHDVRNWPLVLDDDEIEARLALAPASLLASDRIAVVRAVQRGAMLGPPAGLPWS